MNSLLRCMQQIVCGRFEHFDTRFTAQPRLEIHFAKKNRHPIVVLSAHATVVHVVGDFFAHPCKFAELLFGNRIVGLCS